MRTAVLAILYCCFVLGVPDVTWLCSIMSKASFLETCCACHFALGMALYVSLNTISSHA
ncbi:hypothetical protein V5799_020914, partial [Amblyomma americanum]